MLQHRRPSLWRLTAKWCPLVRSHHKQPAPDRVPCRTAESLIAVLPLFGGFRLTLKNCCGRTETFMWSFHPPVNKYLKASMHLVLKLERVCCPLKWVPLMLQYGQRLRTNSSWYRKEVVLNVTQMLLAGANFIQYVTRSFAKSFQESATRDGDTSAEGSEDGNKPTLYEVLKPHLLSSSL